MSVESREVPGGARQGTYNKRRGTVSIEVLEGARAPKTKLKLPLVESYLWWIQSKNKHVSGYSPAILPV